MTESPENVDLPVLLSSVAAETDFGRRIEEARQLVHRHGAAAVASAAIALARRADSDHDLELAFDVISAAGKEQTDILDEAAELVARVGLHHPSVDVRWSAAQLLASTGSPVYSDLLAAFVDDTDEGIRWQVAFGLPIMVSKGRMQTSSDAVKALIRLTQDEDAEVRDWAAFGLGVETDVDSSEVRSALWRRLEDTASAVAGEALVGLARRHDPRIWSIVENRLQGDRIGNLEVMAALELGDRRLYPALAALRDMGWSDPSDPDLLERAMSSCAVSE